MCVIFEIEKIPKERASRFKLDQISTLRRLLPSRYAIHLPLGGRLPKLPLGAGRGRPNTTQGVAVRPRAFTERPYRLTYRRIVSYDSFIFSIGERRSLQVGANRVRFSTANDFFTFAQANISHLRSKYITAKQFHLPLGANFTA